MTLAVNEPSDEVKRLRELWGVLEALNGGTPAMRKASTQYLPKMPAEEHDSYLSRLMTTTLFPAYKRTIGVMAGKPFSQPLTLSDETPPSITAWAEDIDLQGVSLHAFAAEMFKETIDYGLAGVLVEYPRVNPAPTGVRTVAQVEASGARPYFVRVKHDQILGWRSDSSSGRVRLTQLRIMESHEEPDGEFGVKFVSQVRVLEPGSWRIYRQNDDNKGAWVKVDEGRTTLSEIPFVPFYGIRESFMVGLPALSDLAYLNVKHWQKQSDLDNLIHVAQVPILVMFGAAEDHELVVGAATATKLPALTEGTDLRYVEHSGAAIAAGASSIADLENQMIQTGAELLVKKPGDRTATEASNDAEGNKSDLQRITESFGDSMDQALWFMAQFARLPTGGNVKLFTDFGVASMSDANAALVLQIYQTGVISKETLIGEYKRRGVLDHTVDPEAEAEKIADEGPPMGMLGEFGLGPDGKPLPKDEDDPKDS